MKTLLKVFLLLFLTCSAMTCEDEFVYRVDPVDFTLTHINNGGERPEEVEAQSTVNKNAYVLKLDFKLVDKAGESVFSPNHHFKLDTPIESIKVYSFVEGNETIRQDVTDNFKCYQIEEELSNYRIVPLPMTNIDYIVTPSLYLALLTVPEDGTYQFEVMITLKNGEDILQQQSTLIAFHTE